MEKKVFTYLCLIAAYLCCTTGCVPEDEFIHDGMRVNLGAKITSSALSRAEADLEVDYDYDEKLNVSMIRWDENSGDNVYGKEELPATMGTPSTDGNWLREIKFNTTQFYKSKDGDLGFAGWYPRSDNANWEKTDGKVISSSSTMTYNIDGKTDVMVSDFSRGNFQTGLPHLTFSHALCMYKIYAYAVDDNCVKEWDKLTQVTLSNLHSKLKVQLPSTFTAETWKPEFSFFTPDGESKKEEKLLPDGSQVDLEIGTSKAVYVGQLIHGAPADGGSLDENVLYITATTTKNSEGVKVAVVRDFTPGRTYNIYLKFSLKGIINAEVSATDWEYNKDSNYEITQDYGLLTDLSRYGTANCYIVSSANRGYCFDATVKGNGVNTLTKRDGTTVVLPDRDTRLDIDTVAILRSDAMMKMGENGKMGYIDDATERVSTPIIKLLSNKLTDGKIVFEVPGNKNNKEDYSLIYRGNVKIGGYKNGEIVWSWHIWVTDKPQNQGYSNGYVALDRNLGAVTTDYSNFKAARSHWSGLYYQWGRKDPIFRPTVDDNPEWNQVWKREVVEHPVSVAEAHSSPIAYYYDKNGNSNNWTTDTENNDYFWGYISMRDDVKKTLYDPCPPGYRVPGNALWENYISDMTVTEALTSSTPRSFAGYKFNIYGMMDIYYPGAVCLADGKLQNSDDREASEIENFTYMYSATPYDPDIYGQGDTKYQGLAYHFRYNKDKIGTDYSSVMVADPTKYHVKRSAAYPVRCVFESSAPTVTNLSDVQTANSYIVSKSGFYRFRATTRGNGVTGLNIVSGTSSFYRAFDAGMGAGISGIDKVDVLWWQGDLSNGSDYRTFANGNPSSEQIESECPVVMLDNGKLDDGFASFYVTVNEKTYGNVGLAAYDANGKILWSWHIWIQPEVKVKRLGDYTVMDRNLGATYAPENDYSFKAENLYANLGFYYQWGRKDPFFPPNSSFSGTNTDYWFKKDRNGTWERMSNNTVTSKGSIPQSVENPLTFYSSGNTYWQTTYNSSTGEANDFWGYVGSAGTKGDSFAKTMYDPCPPGYRVMQHDVFESAKICNSNDQGTFTISGRTYNSNGVYFIDGMSAKGTISAGGLWFPNSRAINSAGSFTNDGNHRVSTATPFSSGNDLNTREIRWWSEGNRNKYYRIQQNQDNNWMVDGRVVRCQME